jgi:hypothetical protein
MLWRVVYCSKVVSFVNLKWLMVLRLGDNGMFTKGVDVSSNM